MKRTPDRWRARDPHWTPPFFLSRRPWSGISARLALTARPKPTPGACARVCLFVCEGEVLLGLSHATLPAPPPPARWRTLPPPSRSWPGEWPAPWSRLEHSLEGSGAPGMELPFSLSGRPGPTAGPRGGGGRRRGKEAGSGCVCWSLWPGFRGGFAGPCASPDRGPSQDVNGFRGLWGRGAGKEANLPGRGSRSESGGSSLASPSTPSLPSASFFERKFGGQLKWDKSWVKVFVGGGERKGAPRGGRLNVGGGTRWDEWLRAAPGNTLPPPCWPRWALPALAEQQALTKYWGRPRLLLAWPVCVWVCVCVLLLADTWSHGGGERKRETLRKWRWWWRGGAERHEVAPGLFVFAEEERRGWQWELHGSRRGQGWGAPDYFLTAREEIGGRGVREERGAKKRRFLSELKWGWRR